MMNQNQKICKMTAFLLEYPSESLLEELSAMEEEADSFQNKQIRQQFKRFFDYVKSESLHQLCENYVYTFDYHGIVSLHLTYGVFKDSRKRGEALVKLKELYQDEQLMAITDELPDYLPLILEFLSMASDKQSKQLKKLHHQSISKLYKDLKEKDNPYQYLLNNIHAIFSAHLANEDVS